MPSHRCLWCTAVIITMATCGTFIYIHIITGKNQVSSGQSLKYYVLIPEKLSEDKCISVCGSKECVYQSKLLYDFIKQDVDPCDDFYQFSCGRINEKLDPEEDYNIIQRYGDQLITKVKNILDTLEASPTSASGKMKAVYDSCMKYSSSEFQSSFTALEYLDNFGIPGWPNLPPQFRFINTNISRVVASFLVYKEYGFVDFSSEYAFLDVDRNGGKVNTTVINSKSSYEKQDKPERMYMVNRILNYFKVDPETINRVWEEAEVIHDAIIKLREESRLYQAQESETGLLNCTERTENKWEEELCDTLESLIEIAGTAEETNKDIAFIGKGEMHFMQNIFSVLRNFTDRSIANYLALNLFLNNLKDLNSYFHPLRKIQRNDNFMDAKISFLRSEKCIKWIITHMPIALGHEYLKEDLTLPMLREIQDLGEECVREAVELISHQEWLTKDYRKRLKENIQSLEVRFDEITEILSNETDVNEFYDDLEFHPTDEDFLRNVLEYRKSTKVTELRGIVYIGYMGHFRELFKTDMGTGFNRFDIKFGILLSPTYLPNSQRIMNLVSLGLLISHEIGHFFQKFLGEISRKLPPDEIKHFTDKTDCLVDQYSQFRIESIGKNLNGSQTITENLADVIGISIVDKLIEKYTTIDLGNVLPSFQFSFKQQLYIYAVQDWCSVYSKERDELYYNFQSHSPDRFRVLGMMQNSKGFSEAFGCRNGTYMNPVTKCTILE